MFLRSEILNNRIRRIRKMIIIRRKGIILIRDEEGRMEGKGGRKEGRIVKEEGRLEGEGGRKEGRIVKEEGRKEGWKGKEGGRKEGRKKEGRKEG